MPSSSLQRRKRLGRLSIGEQKRLVRRYQAAHAAFARGEFQAALEGYRQLSAILLPHFAVIVRRNLGLDALDGEGDLTDEQATFVLAATEVRRARSTIRRLRLGTREGGTAALCSAVAHDCALVARHLAEGTQHGRDPEVAQQILRGFAHAIAVHPTNAINYHNLAGYEDYLGLDAEACQHYRLALELDPYQWPTWYAYGHALGRLGDRPAAEHCWANVFRILEALDQVEGRRRRWACAMLRLLKGDYERGWDDYEGRLTDPPYLEKHGRNDLTAPLWDGRPTDGTLYLHLEQGIGDALMVARFIPEVRARVGRLIVEVVKPLVPLYQLLFPDLQIVARAAGDIAAQARCADVHGTTNRTICPECRAWGEREHPIPPHDVQLPMFSLPYVCGARLDHLPPSPPCVVRAADGAPIEAEPGRIGLCWRGSTTHANDLVRSMPFEATFPLLDRREFCWQSLQYGYDVSPPLEPMPDGDFLETARSIARCELVITVDTSVAHLAGLMGKPTWLLLPYIAEWRWLQDRDDTPWYPSMRLFRQEKAGDWAGVVARVVDALAERARRIP